MKKSTISTILIITILSVALKVSAEEAYRGKTFPPDEVIKYNIENYIDFHPSKTILGFYKSEDGIYHVAYTGMVNNSSLGVKPEGIWFVKLINLNTGIWLLQLEAAGLGNHRILMKK